MEAKENFLFKTMVNEMYSYFFSDKEPLSIDEKTEQLKSYTIETESLDKSDFDYEYIAQNILNVVNEYNKDTKEKIKPMDLQRLFDDCWIDIAPIYKLK